MTPSHGRSALLLVAALSASGVAPLPVRSAMAADPDFYVSLHYELDGVDRQCWDEAELRRRVAQQVGYDPFRETAAVRVSIRLGGSTRAVDGQVEWQSASGVGLGGRKFVAKDGDCFKLLTEMSFAVGLQIELLRPKASSSADPAGSAKTATSVSDPAVATATPANDAAEPSATEASSHLLLWMGMGPALAWGISPAPTTDARLFLGARRKALSVELGAEASFPSTERQADGSGFRQRLVGGSVAVCGHHHALSACALGKASQLRIAGSGVDHPRSPTGFVGQAGARFAATLALGGTWSATAHLDALGLLTPFTVELNQFAVWEMPRLGALAGIDVSARFR